MEQFYYPRKLQNELYTLYRKKPCLTKLYNSIFDHNFFIEQYKEGIQVLQLYDLRTMELEQIFNLREEKSIKKFGTPIFARSVNERVVAFSTGFRKLFLFFVENGLLLATSEDFGKDVKILLCEFVNEDNTLIIIIQRPENKFGEIYYWNLFSTNDHFKYGGKVNFLKNEKNISSIARIPGKLITINDNGNIFSILDKLTDVCGPEVIGKELHSIVIQKNEVDKVGTPKKMSYSKAKTINNDKKHTVFHRKDSHGEETKPLVNNKEPWAMDNYKRISVYLDDEENIQLFIGRSTIQVWRNKSTGNELEYIWANNVKADNEKDFPLVITELCVGDRSFYAKVWWAELKPDEYFEIRWPYNDNHVTPIKHACDTLEHLYYRRKNLVGHRKQREFESMKDRISYIIWRFIKNKPNIWRLMDMRYDIMAKIIIGGSHTLVKYILFGDGNEEDRNLHIPKLKRCYDEDEEKFTEEVIKEKEKKLDIKNLSDLQIAIRLCKGGLEFNRRSLIVAYLLEYYTSSRSLKHIGWLCTVSGALPDLYKYNLSLCISGYEISNLIEYKDLLPKVVEVEVKASQEEFRAFSPNTTLISKGESRRPIRYYPTKYYANIFFNIEDFSPTIKIVPLYNFTVCELHKRKNDMAQSTPSSPLSIIANFLLKVFRYLFIPRRYLTNNKEEPSKLSPLVQIVRNEEDDDILDNPAIEAAINYKWGPAKKYFLRLFFTYILFATCFAALAGCYLGHIEATGHLRDFLVFIFVLFYYSGIYLFSVEIIQFLHHSWRHYLDFFNFVDLASVVFSLVLISVYVTPTFKLSNAFADVASTSNISAGLSFIMLLLWFEFILYLRLFSEPAKYLYIVLNIIKKTYLFVVFMLLVVLALAHAFLLLLQHMEFHDLDDITPQTTSYTLRNNAGDTTGTAQQIFDRIQDNPSKDFGTSFLATYAWLRGSYPQETTWNSWAVEALTLIGSLFLITVIQNIFIAFIWAVYTEASEKGRVALLKFRAGLISDFEALNEIHFSSPAPEPKYIYSLGNPKSYDAWEKLVKEREGKKLYDDLEEKMNKTKLLFKEKDDENSLLIYEKDEKLVKEREKMKLYDLERIIDKIKEKDEKSVKEGEAKKLVYDLEGLMNEVKLSIKEKSDNNNDDSYSLRSEESIDEDYEYGDDGDYDDDDDDV
ncbi:hypothetical protein RclHR1_03430014 [Rhizophagus clarus]|uniref:Ion transport domain-containing protein n=1 Tax=Rhizophagus clarus TaxID=94130 RepID=A0A2Z6RAK9_9GLOM|nr:hypothetical protein RclHR1_03430014 [Rhizophagus clarus]